MEANRMENGYEIQDDFFLDIREVRVKVLKEPDIESLKFLEMFENTD